MKFKFTSPDSGNQYTLTSDNGAISCDCADFTYRSGPGGRNCKHIQKFVDTYQIVPEPHTRVLAGTIQTLQREVYNAPTRTRSAINTVVSFLGQELADEVLNG